MHQSDRVAMHVILIKCKRLSPILLGIFYIILIIHEAVTSIRVAIRKTFLIQKYLIAKLE